MPVAPYGQGLRIPNPVGASSGALGCDTTAALRCCNAEAPRRRLQPPARGRVATAARYRIDADSRGRAGQAARMGRSSRAARHKSATSTARAGCVGGLDLMLDIDLAILGVGRARLAACEHEVRLGYADVADDDFAQARAGFAHAMLGVSPLYRTGIPRAGLEAGARDKLQRSLRSSRHRRWPGKRDRGGGRTGFVKARAAPAWPSRLEDHCPVLDASEIRAIAWAASVSVETDRSSDRRDSPACS